MKALIGTASIAMLLAAPGWAQTAADEAAVRAVADGLEAAWAANDAAAFAAHFAPDGEMVAPRGLRIHGRDAIAEGHAGVFATIYARSTMTLAVDRVRFLTPDVALLTGAQSIAAAAGTEPQGSAGQALLASAVIRRDGEGWLIEYLDTVPAAPADFALPTADNPSPNGE